jgi:hypothetical protein
MISNYKNVHCFLSRLDRASSDSALLPSCLSASSSQQPAIQPTLFIPRSKVAHSGWSSPPATGASSATEDVIDDEARPRGISNQRNGGWPLFSFLSLLSLVFSSVSQVRYGGLQLSTTSPLCHGNELSPLIFSLYARACQV